MGRRAGRGRLGTGGVLVVDSNPTGRLARFFLGSRALQIVRQAPAPVLVVPAAVAAEAAEFAGD